MERKIFIQEDNFDRARKLIQENSGKRIIFPLKTKKHAGRFWKKKI